VLEALPKHRPFAAYADGDIVFIRPMDLGALLEPLGRGRIAVAVDESTLEYYRDVQALASAGPVARLLSTFPSGPLLQGGLIFTNPADDGGIYELFWELASQAASDGYIPDLPWDDMCLITALLAQRGPLWDRLLVLGHEWNYITDARKDPGVFGCGAHFGGRKAQAALLQQRDLLFPNDSSSSSAWGSVWTEVGRDGPAVFRGAWPKGDDARNRDPVTAPVPFALTWQVPANTSSCVIRARLDAPTDSTRDGAMAHVYVDGRVACLPLPLGAPVRVPIRFDRAETVTVIGVGAARGAAAVIHDPFGVDSAGRSHNGHA
jgi:hypothetical protein